MSDRATPNSITSDLLNDTGFELLEHALFEAKRVVVGQDVMIERLFLCWLARGHCLLEGAPRIGEDAGRRILGAHRRRDVRTAAVHA
jgi:hypothetical protein